MFISVRIIDNTVGSFVAILLVPDGSIIILYVNKFYLLMDCFTKCYSVSLLSNKSPELSVKIDQVVTLGVKAHITQKHSDVSQSLTTTITEYVKN